MHYLIALVLWLGFIGWIVRASSTGSEGQPSWLPLVGQLATGGAVAACAVLVAVVTGITPQFRDAVASPVPPYAAPIAARSPMPPYAPTATSAHTPTRTSTGTAPVLAAAPARVRVAPGTGLRAQPSRNASVLRVTQQGDVLRRFGAANGWVQVGAARPEGWVLEGATTPAG